MAFSSWLRPDDYADTVLLLQVDCIIDLGGGLQE